MNYYTSIDDIILFNWWKIREGDYRYCRKDIEIGTLERDEEAFIQINDSYINEFGISADMQRTIELRTQIAMLQCDYVLEDNNYYRNQIRKLQQELHDFLNRDQGGHDNETILLHLERWMGFRLNEYEITARKFYKIVGEYERIQKK
jgi:hypothetical protein